MAVTRRLSHRHPIAAPWLLAPHVDALTLVRRLELLALCRVAVHFTDEQVPPTPLLRVNVTSR
ncbi:MAG: hypothetical protein ACLQUY_02470 [Ktedonobacterales bacterium]